MTLEDVTIDNLHLPHTPALERFFPEAREAAIIMWDMTPLPYMDDAVQFTVIGAYILGYVKRAEETWRPM